MAYLVELARDGAKGSERRGERGAADIEDRVERAHDGGGPGDDDAGDDAHLAVRIAFAERIGPAPDFDHAPDEAEEEDDAEGEVEALLQLSGGAAARGLGEDGRERNE